MFLLVLAALPSARGITMPPSVAPTLKPSIYDPPRYGADDLVVQLHDFYHAGNDDFNYADDGYLRSVGGFWVATCMIGFLFLIFMWLFSCCAKCACFKRCCGVCFGKCYGLKGNLALASIFLCALVVLLGSYGARGQFLDAAVEVGDALGGLEEIFSKLDGAVVELAAQDYSYSYWVDAAACPASDADDITKLIVDALPDAPQDILRDALAPFTDGVDSMESFELGEMVHQLDEGQYFVENDLPSYIDMGLGILTGLFGVIAITGFVAAFTKCKGDDYLVICLGSIILLVMIVFVGFEIAASVTIADYCYKGPAEATYSLAEFAELDAASLNLVSFYTTCEGENPFMPAYLNMTEAFALLNASATMMKNKEFCDAAPMERVSETCVETAVTLEDMLGTMGCRPLNQVFIKLTHDSFCGPFLWGVYMLWVVHVSASFLIWAAFLTFPCVKELPPEAGGKTYADSSDDGVQLATDSYGYTP